mmetsp:Transcript_19921/g.43312  ORF Transcript_19921/g.43312 Transcript_19921/m.43312 type:complete len:336 (-) Transcript_19921:83-1090(-)
MAPAAVMSMSSASDHHHHHHTKDAVPPSSSSSLIHSSSNNSVNARHTYTHLTYSRHHLVGTAMETIKIAENGEYINAHGTKVKLKDDLDYAVENCVHYDHEFDFYAALQLYDMENNCGTSASGANLLGSLDEAEGGGGTSASTSTTTASRRPKFGRGSIRSGGGGGGLNRSLNSSNNNNNNNEDMFGSLHSSDLLKFSFKDSSLSLSPSRARVFPRTSFLVVSASWLEAASELLNASLNNSNNLKSNPNNKTIRVGVLNSASGTTPGGRFLKGTVSQEDCLCRASLLYSCISQPKFQSDSRFYGKNRSLRYGSSNCVIFSPDVPVIRKDNVEGEL